MKTSQSKEASVKNKTVIVTGANSGVGLETAKVLASKGANVILACRDDCKGKQTELIVGNNSKYFHVNLASTNSITNFVAKITNQFPEIDILINNAGVLHPPYTKTDDGFELTFGVNYLSHFMLTLLLINLIKYNAGSRIVNLTSIAANKPKKIDFNNLNSEHGYNKWRAYEKANLFRLMFSIELNQRLEKSGYPTISVAAHPGITLTNITRNMNRFIKPMIPIVAPLFMMNARQGIAPIIHAAIGDEVNGGESWGVDGIREMRGRPALAKINPLAFQPELRNKLWELSAKFSGIDFP